MKLFYTCLLIFTIFSLFFTIWLFEAAGLVLVFFLTYPTAYNLLKLTHSLYNFEFQLSHSLQLHPHTDQRMITKLYLNYFFTLFQKALELLFVAILLRSVFSSFSLTMFPLGQLYLMQHLYKLAKDMYKEVEKFIMFRR